MPDAIGRRALVRRAGAGALTATQIGAQAGPVVPRSQLLATMLNANTASIGVAAGQTLSQVWPVPDDVEAVGVIVMNDSTAPWSFARLIAAPSQNAYGDDGGQGLSGAFLNPVPASGPASWTNVTWRSRGRLDRRVVQDADELGFEVPPNTQPDPTLGLIGSPDSRTGQLDAAPDAPASRHNVPNFHFSDLVPVRGATAADKPARFIMTRILFGTSQPGASVRGVSCHPKWLGSVQAAGWEWMTRSSATDIVTQPPAVASGEWIGFSPIVGLTYLTRRAGVLMVSCGDSHFDGTTTSIGFGNFAFLTAKSVNRARICPVGYMNLAMSGRSSNTFWPVLNRMVGALHPTIVMLQSWTPNDGGGTPQAEARYWERLEATMEYVRSYGGVPVLLTPIPRDPKTMANRQLREVWQAARERVLARGAAGEPIIDAGASLGARDSGGLTGTYRADIAVTLDAVHPGDLGHAIIAETAVPVISKLLGI